MEYREIIEHALHDLNNCILLANHSIKDLKKYDPKKYDKSQIYFERMAKSTDTIKMALLHEKQTAKIYDVEVNSFLVVLNNFVQKMRYESPSVSFHYVMHENKEQKTISYNKELFEQVLFNILDNSSMARAQNITIRSVLTKNALILSFKDDGKPYTSDTTSLHHGLGKVIIEKNTQQLKASVEHFPGEEGHEVRLVFKLN